MKVLIVSDDALFSRIIAKKVQGWGYQPTMESTGTGGYERIMKEPFRVVITGWDVVGMTGPELCKNIRALKRGRYTYVIIYTKKTDSDSMMAGLEAGADDYLTRPFNTVEFKLRLKNGKRMLNLEDQLREGAGTDNVTGLVNDASFRQFYRVVLAETRRLDERGALMFIHVDNYKETFEEHGYAPAEAMMLDIARALNRTCRNSDLAARLSDEEFCMMLQNTYWDKCKIVAEKIMNHIDNMSIMTGETEIQPKVTFGTVNYPVDELSSEEVLAIKERIPFEG